MSTKCFHLPHGVTIVRWSLGNFSQRHAESEHEHMWTSQLFQVAGNGHRVQAHLMLWPKGCCNTEDCFAKIQVPSLDREASVELNVAMWFEIGPNNRIGINVVTEVFGSQSSKKLLQFQQNELSQFANQENVVICCEIRRVLPPELPLVKDPAPAHLYWIMDELNCAICVVGEWRSDWISIDGRPVECSLRLKHTSKPDSYGGKYKLCLDVKVHELSQPAFYMYYVMWAETLDGRRKSVKRSYVNRFPKTFDDPISSYHFTDQLDKQLLDEFEQKESIVFRAYVKIINELPVHSDDSNIINETTHVQHLNGRTWIQCPVKKFSEMYNNSEKGEFWFSELFSIAGHGHDARACLCIIPVKDRGLSVYLSVVDVVNDAEVYLHSQSWIKKMNRTFESSVTKVKHKYKSRSSKLIAFLSKSDVDHLLQDDSDIVIHCKITRKNALLPMPMNFVPRPTTLSWNLENFRSVLNTPDLYFSPFFLITGYEHLEGCLIFQRFSEPNEDGDQSRLSLIVERKNLCNASGTFHVQLCAKTLDGTSIRKNMTVYTPSTSRLVESLFKPHQFDEQELIRIAREEDEITFECIIEPINLIKTRGEADLIAVLTGNGADTW